MPKITNPATKARIEERKKRALELSYTGYTITAIAANLGVDRTTVYKDLASLGKSRVKEVLKSQDLEILKFLESINKLKTELWGIYSDVRLKLQRAREQENEPAQRRYRKECMFIMKQLRDQEQAEIDTKARLGLIPSKEQNTTVQVNTAIQVNPFEQLAASAIQLASARAKNRGSNGTEGCSAGQTGA